MNKLKNDNRIMDYIEARFKKVIILALSKRHAKVYEAFVDDYSIDENGTYIINVSYNYLDNTNPSDKKVVISNIKLQLIDILKDVGFLQSFITEEINDLNTLVRIINKEVLKNERD